VLFALCHLLNQLIAGTGQTLEGQIFFLFDQREIKPVKPEEISDAEGIYPVGLILIEKPLEAGNGFRILDDHLHAQLFQIRIFVEERSWMEAVNRSGFHPHQD
jgi:hypothetical protein